MWRAAPPTSPLLGAPGTETWTFEALKVGTTAMDYSRPWQGGEKGAGTFMASVEVR
jgi:inhibitor of cysteine peptidase